MFQCEIYVCALVGVIIKVILQNSRCNNKDFSSYLASRIFSSTLCIKNF